MTTLRIVDRVVAAVLALALLVGGLLVAIEIALQALWLEEPWVLPWDAWYREGVDTPWSDPVVRGICIGLVVVALLLLALQLARRKPPAMALESTREGLHVDLDRRGLEQWLGARLSRVDGVASADVRARRRSVQVSAAAVSRDTPPVERSVTDAAKAAIDGLQLAKRPAVKVDVSSRRTS